MAGAEESRVVRKEHEPISMVCLVVLLLAGVLVIGMYVSDQISGDSSESVQYGDTVKVEYTGSLYGYYNAGTDEVIPLIFDTNVSSIGKNTDYLFTNTFSGKYDLLSVTIGSKEALEGFENGLIGHKVGDTVKIRIAGADAYPAIAENQTGNEFTVTNDFTMTLAELKANFEDVPSSIIGLTVLSSQLNDNLKANVLPSGNNYHVQYILTDTDTYDIYDNEKIGKVTMTIASISGSSVTYTLDVTGTKPVETEDADGNPIDLEIKGQDAFEMISVTPFPSTSVNHNPTFNLQAGSGSNLVYNTVTNGTSALIGGYDLYFVVKIVSKS